MSNLSQFFGGAKGSAQPDAVFIPFFTSGTFTALKDGIVRLTAAGAGAQGGVAKGTGSRATGGSGPGFVPGVLFPVKANDTWVITVGAPPVRTTISGSASADGGDGGDTTITGPGVGITVHGGQGGKYALSGEALPSVPGGTVEGCFGYQGGSSGGVAATSALGACATGGGALNIFGLPPENVSSGNCNGYNRVSGGASPGGGSADTSFSTPVTGGGGTGGASVDISGGPDILGGPASGSSPTDPSAPTGIQFKDMLVYARGAGGAGAYFTTSSAANSLNMASTSGGASGGACSTQGSATSGPSGSFAGSGGAASGVSSVRAGAPGIGASSGGSAQVGSSASITQEAGGAAFVLLEVFYATI